MHAALAIPEIVDEILTYCARPEASRLGRTCRVLFEPAMDIVWKEPSSDALRELLYAKNEGDTAPPLLPTRIEIGSRGADYLRRVRILELDEVCYNILDPSSFQGTSFNIQKLILLLVSSSSIESAVPFIFPGLRRLDLRVDPRTDGYLASADFLTALRKLLRGIPAVTNSLEELSLRFFWQFAEQSLRKGFESDLLTFLSSVPHLQELVMTHPMFDLDHAVLAHISGMGKLGNVSLNVQSFPRPLFSVINPTAFPAMRVLRCATRSHKGLVELCDLLVPGELEHVEMDITVPRASLLHPPILSNLIRSIARHYSTLRVFILRFRYVGHLGEARIAWELFTPLMKCRSLVHFQVYRTPGDFSDEKIDDVIEAWPALETFRLTECRPESYQQETEYSISHRGLEKFAQLRQLTWLSLPVDLVTLPPNKLAVATQNDWTSPLRRLDIEQTAVAFAHETENFLRSTFPNLRHFNYARVPRPRMRMVGLNEAARERSYAIECEKMEVLKHNLEECSWNHRPYPSYSL